MKNNAFEQALSKAVMALEGLSDKELRQLPIVDCAWMLSALPDMASLSGMRALLAVQLRGWLSVERIEHDDAYAVYSALVALWQYDSSRVAGAWLAAAIHRLVQSEADEGGPYYTGDTVVVAHNVQIAIFVSVVARPLPNMECFLKTVVVDRRFEGGRLTSFALLYLLAAACDSDGLSSYADTNWRSADWQTPWRQVVALAALKNKVSRAEIDKTLRAVCGEQEPSGFWRGEPLDRGFRRNRRSSWVTTSLIVRALYDYTDTSINLEPGRQQQKRQVVAQAAAKAFDTYSEPLRSSALRAAHRICSADSNSEITLLPQFFAAALATPKHVAAAQHTMLGLANVCAWVAYSIYDDFIDEEGKPADLPVANVATRATLDCFRAVLPDNVRFHQYVSGVFDGMDEANAWEVDHCRFTVHGRRIEIAELPRYGKRTVLARRAFAHALTPMAILAFHAVSSPKKAHIEAAFRHYLIARQLNDDLHDWVNDIRVGQASYVVTATLRDMRVIPGEYNFDTLLPAMRRCFRRTTMPKVCQRMLWHIALSKQYFAKSQLLHSTNDIYLLLDNLELSAHDAMDRQTKGQALADINPA